MIVRINLVVSFDVELKPDTDLVNADVEYAGELGNLTDQVPVALVNGVEVEGQWTNQETCEVEDIIAINGRRMDRYTISPLLDC
tara:strand:+ start:181 stop:432 length:252 start_codon:yes stop_codon:yes gene_type:complete